ncbi:tyrosine-type recombinase/integrase [Carnobacterium pleistocenium]|uniref:tyrosine-type recombinase/integrase n=1 Tax=Carnobacterium pleistocenium TaxID=181073 RepID=UPI0005569360|nr:site-specific integrase [Carnobacterium pleistocenium]
MWVQETKDGNFQYFERYKDPYTQNYKTKSVRLITDSSQSRKKAQKILDKKIAKALDAKEQQSITFHEVYEEWYKTHIRSLRPSSIVVYDSIKKHVLNYIKKDILINRIDTKFLQKFFNQLEFSDQYISSFKSTLGLVFKYAHLMEYIDKNPLDNVVLNKRTKTFADIQRIKNKFLEQSEAESLLSELYRRPSTYRLARLAEFMYLTGVRFGEAVILTEKDFELENKLVKITGTIDRTKGYKNAKKGPTKTAKSMRDISITSRTSELVKQSFGENQLANLDNKQFLKGKYIFVTKSGTPIQNNSFNIALKRAGERVGLEDKELSSHIFRHSHVSLLAEKNIPLKAIMDRVGHEDADITNRIYTHVTSQMKTNIIDQLESNGL